MMRAVDYIEGERFGVSFNDDSIVHEVIVRRDIFTRETRFHVTCEKNDFFNERYELDAPEAGSPNVVDCILCLATVGR